MTYTLLIHGGAGNIRADQISEKKQAEYAHVLQAALAAGHAILDNGGDAVLAVEAAVCILEDSPLFNAGRGAVFTKDGTQEMDAAIMDGTGRNAGGVTCVQHVRNPVKAARAVLEKSQHVLLAGEAAENFVKQYGIELADADYFFDQHRWDQLQEIKETGKIQLDFAEDDAEPQKYGTVGAVACDANGNLAAATSTGGMTNKQPGRVGDTPIIGAGCYADNASCAVSCTGQGEYFMRGLIAHNVAQRMRYQQIDLDKAANRAIAETLSMLGGHGGLIAVDAQGNFAMPFNTPGMFRGVAQSGAEPRISMFK